MAIPISPKEETRYVPESDRKLPRDQQSYFIVRPLTAEEEAHVKDHFGGHKLQEDGQLLFQSAASSRNLRTLDLALVSWGNFPPGAAEGAGFSVSQDATAERPLGRRLASETMSMIPSELRGELAVAIWELSHITPRQEKNSESPAQ